MSPSTNALLSSSSDCYSYLKESILASVNMSRPRQTLHTGLLLLFLSVLIFLVTGTTHCCGLFTLPARRLAPAGVTVLGGPKKPNPCLTRGADKHDNINFHDLKIHPKLGAGTKCHLFCLCALYYTHRFWTYS